MNLNVVILGGNLTAAPEMRKTPNGKSVAGFTLAVNGGTKQYPRTDFVKILTLGKTAEYAATHLSKGSGVVVVGELETRSYEKDGTKRYTFDILCKELKSCDKPAGTKEPAATADVGEAEDIANEDLPF